MSGLTRIRSFMTWLDTLNGLYSAGLITAPEQLDATAWGASAPFGWGAVAREAAASLPGFVMPSTTGGIAWKCGGGPMAGVIVDMAHVRPIAAARDIVRAVIPAADRPSGVPWTYGSCARRLLLFAAEAQPKDKTCEQLINPDADIKEYMYHDCIPGLYPEAIMWDGGSYFFNLLRRLPSLRVSLGRPRKGGGSGVIRFERFTPDECERWADVLTACTEHKVLRNSLWGASLGSLIGRVCYTSAAPKDAAGKRAPNWAPGRVREIYPVFGAGPFRPAALLLARSAAELTQLASEEVGSVYSTVDSVTSIDGREPAAWGRVGLPYGIKAEGEAHIIGRGCWRIAANPTLPYCPRKRIGPAGAPIGEGRRLTSWEIDIAGALLPGYCPTMPEAAVPRSYVNNYYYRQWL